MNKVLKAVDGKKTYIGAAIIFVAGGLQALCQLPVVNVCINEDTYQGAVAIGLAVAAYGLRHALKKVFNI